MTEEIKEAIRQMMVARPYYKIIEAYAKEEYYKQFPREKVQEGTWHCYDDFEIVDDGAFIRVKFKYGAGEIIEYSDSFLLPVL